MATSDVGTLKLVPHVCDFDLQLLYLNTILCTTLMFYRPPLAWKKNIREILFIRLQYHLTTYIRISLMKFQLQTKTNYLNI